MGRHRGPKFFFPIPGRRSHPKVDHTDNSDALSPKPSNPSLPSVPEWSPRFEEPLTLSYSKAQRVLGTAGPPFRQASKPLSVPPSPGYMTITASEGGSEFDDKAESMAIGDGSFAPPQRPNLSNRASSNILPADMAYTDRRGSNCSSVSRQLNARSSNSTMRSHYDAQKSPLSISQQTSDSAVRDMALRKGKPRIGTYGYDEHTPSPLSHEMLKEAKKEQRKSKPPRLDLSKLFPKPKANERREHGALLSPTKMRQQAPAIQPARSTSPVRLHKRDTYDSTKIHIRRPPRGIQHWFEGFDEGSDDLDEDDTPAVHAPQPVNPVGPHLAPMRKSSLGRLVPTTGPPKPQTSRASQYIPNPRKEQYMYANLGVAHSQSSLATTKTKESSISKLNLQDSSVLSFSSSEDEDDSNAPTKRKVSVRDSIDMTELQGDIVIGQAQALEVRPRNSRRPSVGKLSLLSTSTNSATIEMMYTPEPYAPHHFPRTSNPSRRSSHLRQPSVIPEDDDIRPKTAANPQPLSPSSHSIRTTRSEPRSRQDTQKLMAVTAEEMALLEALRKKRADMQQQSWVEGYVTAVKQEEVRQITPPDATKKSYRTSAFLSADSPSSSPVRLVDTKKQAVRKSMAPTPTPLLVPSRGRSSLSQDLSAGTSMLRDSSSCAPRTKPPLSPSSPPHRLSPAPEFSPPDPFPSSPTQTASVASLTTTNHPSPLPSPITPGLRHGEGDVLVKVASSEPSCDGDDEVAVLETGVIDVPTGSIKPDESHTTHHQRRRTASSGTDVPMAFPSKPSIRDLGDLTTVSEASSRTPSVNNDAVPSHPKVPRKSPHRQSTLSMSTFGHPKSRNNSVASLRTASPVTERRRAASRVSSSSSMKRESVAVGLVNTRCSVSEDVLAAWGSLGGLRDYERPRY
ncbi:hypothetical protein K458DRAFT_99647 [Lentithecium fluviatile CBS 122367]|uniref:Uncharacterized protein n=1 Tax=Lentithecium fluviatile CBS 122367 TaxID=1168545 RepID=A0A6G1JJ28_9PLEO|nr:hypothetical protein K458DRAFT_99647 [Lentithecium fluviatile CBS 122367]